VEPEEREVMSRGEDGIGELPDPVVLAVFRHPAGARSPGLFLGVSSAFEVLLWPNTQSPAVPMYMKLSVQRASPIRTVPPGCTFASSPGATGMAAPEALAATATPTEARISTAMANDMRRTADPRIRGDSFIAALRRER